MRFVLDDLDENRKVGRKLDQAGGMDHAARAESCNPVDDGCAREALSS
jgi:hypothetical protein